MKLLQRIDQAFTLLVATLLLCTIFLAVGAFCFALVDESYFFAFAMLVFIVILCQILSVVPQSLRSASDQISKALELTPESLEISANSFVYRFRNRYLKSSQLGNHVVSYVVIDIDAKYIHFLNCAIRSEIKCPEAFPFDKQGRGWNIYLLSHYTNYAGCEISNLVDTALADFGGYYLIYWPGHLAIVAKRTPEFPKFEATLKDVGFDIKTRVYVPPEKTNVIKEIRNNTFTIGLIPIVIIASLVAPMRGPAWVYYLYVIIICGSMLSAIWYLFYRWEKHVIRKRMQQPKMK